MQTKSRNPYYAVTPVRDPAMFFGRVRLLGQLYSVLDARQCVSLVGWRRFGKTSILICMDLPEMQQRFACDLSHYVLVFIDFREYLKKTADQFFKTVTKQIVLKSRGRLELLPPAGSGQDKFSDILEQIKEQGYHTVLLMDAFDSIMRNEKFDLEFFAFLRAQVMLGRVSYVTASLAPLYDVSHHDIKESPFFNIFRTCYLEPLTLDEARDLIAVPAERSGLPFTKQDVAWVLELAGRHPFFLQCVCYCLFEEKNLGGSSVVNYEHVMQQSYKDLRPHFEDAWMRLEEPQREALKLEAQRRDGQQRKLPELSESALFRAFVRDKCPVAAFEMSKDDLEEILKKMDDARFLGESNLTHLHIVSARIKKNNAVSASEKGVAIREILNEAFEHMRGPGMRRDAASEWQLYNILYYRYFKYHLPNGAIEARLEFTSTRQYFRARKEAINSLYNNLLEMEAAFKQSNGE